MPVPFQPLHAFPYICALLLSLVVAAPLATAADEPAKPVRVLAIGNSFSNNATRFLPDLAKSGGQSLMLRSCSVGGASLEVHWKKVEAFEQNPEDPAGLYGSKLGLRQELAREPWDFVTIQQASIKSHDFATFQPFAGSLAEYIRKCAPQSKLLIHETWAYRVDDPRFTKPSAKPGEPTTQEAMYEGLQKAYAKIAAELSAGRIPTGDAFFLADRDPKWGYRADAAFDPVAAMHPKLPDQSRSLHVGWRWAKSNDQWKLQMDGHHANDAGCYLAGCVFYETLFGQSPVGLSFVPKGLDPAYARFLQETAHRAVEGIHVSVK